MVELVLEEKDAVDWVYRGEGAANLVLAYTGSSPNFIGKVLRVQKAKRNRSEGEEGPSVLSIHECLVWKDTESLALAQTRDIAKHLYVQHVMCAMLGSEHVDAGVPVLVTREFLESVRKNVLPQRPSWRANETELNTLCDSAILMSDHTIFPRGVHEEELCISVEIKPKCGFLPPSRFITEENSAKRSISRFRLHQILKWHQRKILQMSEYDPLDMFSRSWGRVLKSVKDLFLTPQNNFRVFLNGSLVFGSLASGKGKIESQTEEEFEDILKNVIRADDGRRTDNFLQLVAKAVSESGVMDRLLEVQKLDVFDIEGAIHAYYDVMSQPCVVCKELGEGILSSRYNSLHSMTLDEKLKIVRNYLISATAKDLSLMISFRPRKKQDSESHYNVVFLETTDQSFDYKVAFIDLDMKPLKKMTYYYELDQKILDCYTQMLETANQHDKSANLVDTRSNTIEDSSNTTRDFAEGSKDLHVISTSNISIPTSPRNARKQFSLNKETGPRLMDLSHSEANKLEGTISCEVLNGVVSLKHNELGVANAGSISSPSKLTLAASSHISDAQASKTLSPNQPIKVPSNAKTKEPVKGAFEISPCLGLTAAGPVYLPKLTV